MAKKLNITTDLTDGYLLYSLVSPLVDYRLSFFINQNTGLNLKKYASMPWERAGQSFRVSWYYDFDDQISTAYYLIGNRSQGTFLIPELRKIDYLLLIKSPLEARAFEGMIANIRKVQQVFAVLQQGFSGLTLADELMEVNEMHELDQIIKPARHLRYKPQN